MHTAVRSNVVVALAIAATALIAGSARATTITLSETTYTVSGVTSRGANANSAFCGSTASCDFSTPTGGNGTNTVPSPTVTTSTTSAGIPIVSTASPGVNGFNASTHALEWWTPGTYTGGGVTTTVVQSAGPTNIGTTLSAATSHLFSDTTFFPPGKNNDVGSSLTAEFKGSVSTIGGPGGTLLLSGLVDDNILIYLSTGGGNYTLTNLTPVELSNQPGFSYTDSITLAAGTTYGLEIFYADRSSTAAELTIDAAFTAAVPEASTWAMMVFGFLGVGFMAYRRKNNSSFRLA